MGFTARSLSNQKPMVPKCLAIFPPLSFLALDQSVQYALIVLLTNQLCYVMVFALALDSNSVRTITNFC